MSATILVSAMIGSSSFLGAGGGAATTGEGLVASGLRRILGVVSVRSVTCSHGTVAG